jgi:hypothetical protein
MELWPLMGQLSNLQVILQWWNDIYGGKLKNSEKSLFQCQYVHHNYHMDCLGVNYGFHSEKLAASCLSYGTALYC